MTMPSPKPCLACIKRSSLNTAVANSREDRNRQEVEWATFEWVDWFNNRRLFEPIAYVPPAELGAIYHQ